MSAPALSIRGVSKAYGGIAALRGIDFDAYPGEVHAIVGENGAGKSTLIKVITGAHAPDSGKVSIDGRVVERFDPAYARRLGVACIYQQPALFPDLTVTENIALRLSQFSAWHRVDWKASARRSQDLLSIVGASIPPMKEAGALSMPEQQLVEIACAFGTGARIVVMDEPTASLTRTEQELLFSLVRKLRASGTSVIYISHRLEEIMALADRISVLRDGERIGTYSAKEMDESRLVHLMVGREINRIFPAKDSATGEVVLSVRKLGNAATGVHNVTFEARAGEIFGLAGLVGSGRTELARILFGVVPADHGEVMLEGRSVRFDTPSQAIGARIAYVPEDRRRQGVVMDMTIAENVSMCVQPSLFPWAWIRRGAENTLARDFIRKLGIKTTGPEQVVRNLSGGNQQKVSLSRSLAIRPRLLILDEPTQGIDVGSKSEVHGLVRRLAKEGMAVVLISSDLPEILGMCDRIGVMRGGALVDVLEGSADAQSVMACALGLAKRGDAA
jgi:rhamnose transport system ATP-binding protein